MTGVCLGEGAEGSGQQMAAASNLKQVYFNATW